MRKIIITGFEPFGPYNFNPSKDLALFYDSKIINGDKKVIGIVLPCTYYGAFHKLSDVIERENPYAIISIGLSSLAKGVRIETVFKNIMNGKYSDADEYNPKGDRIDERDGAAKFIGSQADNIYLANLLYFNDVPVEISGDADSFICNSLAYQTSQKIFSNYLPIKNVFIHIPWTDKYKNIINLEVDKMFLDQNVLYKAVDLLIKNI